MAKIRHIAIATQDPEGTARFYVDVFGLERIARIDAAGVSGYYLSDGDINVAILRFKDERVAGVERGLGFSGLHHIGFQVDSLEKVSERLAAAGARPRDDINQALGVGQGEVPHANVEVKYGGPDGVVLDVSETGWVGTPSLRLVPAPR